MKKLIISLCLLPCLAYATFTIPASGSNSGTNSGDVTQSAFGSTPNAYGFTITGQALNLQPADATHPGGVSISDWNTFNSKVGSTRAVNTTAPITGGGALSGDLTIAMAASTNSVNGYLSSADHTTFNAKQGTIKIAVIEEQQASNTNAGTASTGSYLDRVLNTVVTDDIGVSLASNTVTLPAGTYTFEWTSPFFGAVNETRTRLFNNTSSAAISYSVSNLFSSGANLSCGQSGKVVLSVSTDIKLQYQVGTTNATFGLGHEASGKWSGTEVEVYSHLKIIQYL